MKMETLISVKQGSSKILQSVGKTVFSNLWA